MDSDELAEIMAANPGLRIIGGATNAADWRKINTAANGVTPDTAPLPKKPRRHEEDQLIADIIEAAHLHGWLIMHPRPGRTRKGWVTAIQGDAGSPDLLLIHAGRGLFVLGECKSNEGDLYPAQRIWRDAIREALSKYWYRDMPIRYEIWRPSDWPDICTLLEGK